MKGIVFQGFLNLVEDTFGLEVMDAIIEESNLASGGAYTSVGTYDYGEIVTMAGHLSERTGIPLPDLVRTFGTYLFTHLATTHPALIAKHSNAFDMLDSIERDIHREVRKLYPDAELPYLDCEIQDDDTLELLYRSKRPLSDVAHGLIEGCAAHFNEPITITREDRSSDSETSVMFTVRRVPQA